MITSRVQLATVGGFVLLMLVSLIVILAVLAGRTGGTDEYFTVYPNVAGVKYGTQVLYEGYPIGQVEDVVPISKAGGMSFEVRLSVIEDWRIPRDSEAAISVNGLLAPATIAIRAGTAEQALAPGEMITPGHSAGLFAAVGGLGKQFESVSREGLIPLLENLDGRVTQVGELLDGDVAATLANLQRITAELDANMPSLMAELRQFSGGLAKAGDQMGELVTAERIQELDTLLRESAVAASRLGDAARRVDALVQTSGDDVSAGTRDLRESAAAIARHIDSLTHNLDAASRDLAEFSRQIRNDPSRVLRRTRPAEEPQP